jgi:hypothetical protein
VAKVKLRDRTEATRSSHLHFDAAFDDSGDGALERDAQLERLAQLFAGIRAATQGLAKHHTAATTVDFHDAGGDLIADLDGELAIGTA